MVKIQDKFFNPINIYENFSDLLTGLFDFLSSLWYH